MSGEHRPKRRLPDLKLLTSTIESAQLSAPEQTGPEQESPTRVLELPLDVLWLEHQPREIVPDEELQRLIAEGQAQPRALLGVLRDIAQRDQFSAEILRRLEMLGRSIASQGVLQPIEVVRDGPRYIVRDGHRRCLGSLLADRSSVPAVVVAEQSDLEAVARPLILNVQREDLTALEKGAALLRLALLVGQRLASEDGSVSISLDDLLSGPVSPDEDGVSSNETASKPPRSRALSAQVRDRVCAMVGLQPRTYYRLLALNRLVPAARALGRGLTEGQLRPLVNLEPEDQAEIVGFVVRRNLSAKESASLAQVVQAGDRDAVRRVMARMSNEESARRRTSVSWEPLLHAVPKDVWRRCLALRSELEALPAEHRRARLDTMWEQDRLLEALRAEFRTIFEAHGYSGPSTPLDEEEGQ